MSKEKKEVVAQIDLGSYFEIESKKAQKMSRRELEEAILVELKAVQSELRLILEVTRPKNS